MTHYLLAMRFGLLNLAGFALAGAAAATGLVERAINADVTGLTALIGAVFLVGLGICTQKVWRTSHDINVVRDGDVPAELADDDEEALRLRLFHRIAIVRFIANTLVLLGLIGTVLGFIIALGGVDPDHVSDVAAIGPMVATLVQGMSTALYTTLVGAVLHVWLTANHTLLATGAVKLILAMEKRRV